MNMIGFYLHGRSTSFHLRDYPGHTDTATSLQFEERRMNNLSMIYEETVVALVLCMTWLP